jgi:hypothetical protein
MTTYKQSLPYSEAIRRYSFPLIIFSAMFMAFLVKGAVFNGMFMGIVWTIALWILIVKLPRWLKALMGRHILMSDLALSLISFGALASMGPGPTIVAAATTQATLMSVLLRTLPKN